MFRTPFHYQEILDLILTQPFVTIIILVVFLSIVVKTLLSRKWLSAIIDHLKGLALTVLLAGFVLYFYGYWMFFDEELNFIALTLRSFLSSLGMFALQSDLQYFVQDSVKYQPVFLGIFAVVHFLAALVSAIFIVNFVGIKLVSWLKMRKAKGQDLYIFWGMNENSISLAEDTYYNKTKGNGGMLIFVGTIQDEDIDSQQFSISALINGESRRKDRIRRIEKIKAIITYCSEKITLEKSADSSVNILKTAGLKSLSSVISKSKDKEIRFFFLFDDLHYNLELTSLLLNAIEQKDEALYGCEHLHIYCHARKNKENRVFEKLAFVKSEEKVPNVHLIDSANLAIQTLKRNVDYQPVSFVNPQTKTATVDDQFSALVLGFGETGRDAVRFLYEFGAFPDSKGERSPFRCYAIDEQMDRLAGNFYNNAPALKGNHEIELLQMTIQSELFWEWIDNNIETLNYIVISCGDDEVGIQLAIDLLEKAIKTKGAIDNFKIFIRSYSNKNENRLDEIANFYNQKAENCLVIFGKHKELYTSANIIDEEAIENAKVFYNAYALQTNETSTWEDRHEIKDKKKDEVTLDDINGVIRKENQDIANYRHIDTKLTLVGLSRDCTNDELDALTPDQKLNLAICEHLRWNASHEMLGYVCGNDTDDMRKTHCYLKPWADLDEDIKAYDATVVNTTLEIVRK